MQLNLFGKVFYLSKTVVSLLVFLLGGCLVLGGYLVFPKEGVQPPAVETSLPTFKTMEPTATPQVWHIYIVGAVVKPGLYTVKEGALLYDAIQVAGGLDAAVNVEKINLAQVLQPNLMVQILTESERLKQERESSVVLFLNNTELKGVQLPEEGKESKVNINLATKEQLMTLSGIGEARAESIIAYREEYGPFQTIEDIMLVSGIKESAFLKIKDKITT